MKSRKKINDPCRQLRLTAIGIQVEKERDDAPIQGISNFELAEKLFDVEIP